MFLYRKLVTGTEVLHFYKWGMNEVKPPADATDFLKVFYRASAGINPGANSAGEFD